MDEKMIYFFGDGHADGNRDMKDLLGGKGAGLAEMTNAGVPVPPGFTITTEVCKYYEANNGKVPPEVDKHTKEMLGRIGKLLGRKFGDPENPLLVSVRSGAKFSMPGMMDTVLNLGLNDRTVEGLAKSTNNQRLAWDAYRRFLQMFGNVVMEIEKDVFEQILADKKKEKGVQFDTELNVEDLKDVVSKYKEVYQEKTGAPFPQDPFKQLEMARNAVFRSWDNPRAVTYRKLNRIPEDLGTAVNVQAMVFGNMGEDSATGVGFTRDPATGKKEFYGEYLVNAQGEDVVAGIRTPQPISRLKDEMPEVYKQLEEITQNLERHYRDVQDFEFTIERGKLFMLQTRTGKRTGIAALRIAVDMHMEGLITKEEAIMRVLPEQIDQLLHPMFQPQERAKYEASAKGLPASPGAATGRVVFTADEAVEETGEAVILVRNETCPDDIHGMHAAQGILTATGGMTSHAAVVARGMGKPCVVGCGELKIDEEKDKFTIHGRVVKKGDWVSIDGMTGEVFVGKIPTGPSEIIKVLKGEIEPHQSELYQYYQRFMSWVDEVRQIGVRANADVPGDARMARLFGAEGIGLCRTEHMFFGPDRISLMQKMILTDSESERRKALEKLKPLQKEDFLGLFQEMKGYPVIIRTLDPPLHEFLPKSREEAKELAQKMEIPLESVWGKIQSLHEFNPMLGHRGCRLGVTYPEITEMQVQAIIEAACELAKKGETVIPEIMIPLVGHVNELRDQKEVAMRVAKETMERSGVKIKYYIGTMIEVPRAALTADEIAKEAEFFSFGTNDLTQMGFGFSRDDTVKFLWKYLEKGILKDDPFQTLDQEGIGELIKIAIEKGKRTRRDLEIGICGEHGGDPESVKFCHRVGMDYVSCSPFRIPIARLSAAQATLTQ
jgi:pyruvate,orthophosphate dikinase